VTNLRLHRANTSVAYKIIPWRGADNTANSSLSSHFIALFCGIVTIAGIASAHSAPLEDAAERYRPQLVASIDQARAGAQKLRDCIDAGDVGGAKTAWIEARIGWERSEVFTGGFVPDLDRNIDAWPDATTGFHAIEAKLFADKSSDAQPEAAVLLQNLNELSGTVRNVKLPPQLLLDGVARLAYEVGDSKVDGGESRISGTSLDDMRNNVDGIDIAYRAIFASALESADPPLATLAGDKIAALKKLVEARDLKQVDSEKLRATSEELVLVLQRAAPKIGLQPPTL
jgi:iron uptake system component EfeO